jgi:uncharacterized protein (DUF433 family)
MSQLDRITTDPAICHGQPTVRGLRYPVENLLRSVNFVVDAVFPED